MTGGVEDNGPREDRTAGPGVSGFRDGTSLSNWTRGFLFVFVIASLVAIWDHAERALDPIDAEVPVALRVTWYAAWTVTAILILAWTHRANYNARRLGAADMDFTPMRAAGWYLVPVAWFWKPYQVMREIWQASTDPSGWRGTPVSPLLRRWWALWIAWMWGWEIAMFAGVLREGGSESLAVALLAAYFLLVVTLCLVLRAIIGEVNRLQLDHHRGRAGSTG